VSTRHRASFLQKLIFLSPDYCPKIMPLFLLDQHSRLPLSFCSMDFFNWPNPSSSIIPLGSTQPLTEMSTRNLLVGKWRPARKADNLTVICEPTV
jgi:hypothetical protein